jgi:hypothetical protein
MHDLATRGRHGHLCADETPFNPTVTFSNIEEAERAFGLKPSRHRETRACVLANLVYAELAGFAAVHYSRDRSYYSAHRRGYRLPHWTYTKVMAAVADLEALGWLIEDRTQPGSERVARSRMLLRQPVPTADFTLIVDQSQLVVLKDADGAPRPYRNSSRIQQVWRDIEEHNAFLSQFAVTLVHADVRRQHGLLYQGAVRPIIERSGYYRVFNETWEEGGRWYGPWWQNCGKDDLRALITIDGQDTRELDYRTLHPRLVCALAGIDLPFDDKDGFDLYDIGGFERSHVKLAVNIMINAESTAASVRALCEGLRDKHHIASPGLLARELVRSVSEAYPALDRYWNSGIGLRLQRLDGDMCGRVQRRLRHDNIPVLSVHDSFIVPRQHTEQLRKVMEDELALTLKLAKQMPMR